MEELQSPFIDILFIVFEYIPPDVLIKLLSSLCAYIFIKVLGKLSNKAFDTIPPPFPNPTSGDQVLISGGYTPKRYPSSTGNPSNTMSDKDVANVHKSGINGPHEYSGQSLSDSDQDYIRYTVYDVLKQASLNGGVLKHLLDYITTLQQRIQGLEEEITTWRTLYTQSVTEYTNIMSMYQSLDSKLSTLSDRLLELRSSGRTTSEASSGTKRSKGVPHDRSDPTAETTS